MDMISAMVRVVRGNINTLKKDADNLIDVEVISQISYHPEKVGSTLIVTYFNKEKLMKFIILGRYYQISGTVVSGNKIAGV